MSRIFTRRLGEAIIIIPQAQFTIKYQVQIFLSFTSAECIVFSTGYGIYRGDGKSLARPGRKQATATEDSEFHISYLCRYQ